MKRLWVVVFLSCFALVGATSVRAQEAPSVTVMATYYRCVQGDAARADAIFHEQVLPFFQSEKSAGRIADFGWGKHWSGGDWRRFFYMSGPDPDKVLASYLGLIQMAQSPQHAKAMDDFDRICGSHDDYTWGVVAGSQAPNAPVRARSANSTSTYYVCGAAEPEADAIVKFLYAPVLNQRVKEHKIDAWSWLVHMMGGKYRRALVIDGADPKSLIQNWVSLDTDLAKANPELAHRFTEICPSHSDYIWELSNK